MKPDKIATLDGLRGLAALLVLWAHFPLFGGSIAYLSKKLATFTYAGYIGVDIFFALSGFLITRILIREKANGILSFKNFYLKRSLRIFPIYYISIVAVGILINWQHLEWVALYVSNYFFSFNHDPNPMRHTWSLCVEEHFYLFWPLIIRFCDTDVARRIISVVIPGAVITVAIGTVLFAEEQLAKDLLYRATHIRILTLALGSSIAFYEPTVRSLSTRSIKFIVLTLAGVLIFMRTYYKVGFLERLPSYLVELIVFAFFSAVVLILVIRLNDFPRKIWAYLLTNPVITYCGKISYGIYLYHYPILFFMGFTEDDAMVETTVQKGLLAVVLCFAVPALSYRFIEQPLLRIKDRVLA